MKEKELSLSNTVLVELMQEAFTRGTCFRFQVKGFSMLPFIRDGDVITISSLSHSSSLELGDSFAFIHPETKNLVIHRLISKQGNFYLVKGDNVSKPDGLIRRENILGHVAKVERKDKKILFGFGPERFLIALLSRGNVFYWLLSMHRVIREALRRSAS